MKRPDPSDEMLAVKMETAAVTFEIEPVSLEIAAVKVEKLAVKVILCSCFITIIYAYRLVIDT